jgi:hypothetical protein
MSNTVLAGLVAIACMVIMYLSTCIKNKLVKGSLLWVTLCIFLISSIYVMLDLWFDNFPRWLRTFFPGF